MNNYGPWLLTARFGSVRNLYSKKWSLMNRKHQPSDVPYYDEEMTQYILDAYASAPDSIKKCFEAVDRDLLKRVSYATLEQKLYLLGKLGKRFAIVVADRGKISINPLTFKEFTGWCKRRLAKLVGSSLKQWGLFIRGDKELIQNLSRISIDINPKTMYLLRNYEEIAVGIDEVSHIKLKSAVESQSIAVVDRFILRCYSYKSQLPRYNKYNPPTITQEGLLVLFYLSVHRERLIAPLEIGLEYGWDRRSVMAYLRQFTDMGITQEDIMFSEVSTSEPLKVFQLTGYGLTVINQIRDKIIYQ
jgi:hypothetical protein